MFMSINAFGDGRPSSGMIASTTTMRPCGRLAGSVHPAHGDLAAGVDGEPCAVERHVEARAQRVEADPKVASVCH